MAAEHERKMTVMIQIKDKKTKYRNSFRRKAKFRGRGFYLNSKIYKESLRLFTQIKRQTGKKRKTFSSGKGVKVYELR